MVAGVTYLLVITNNPGAVSLQFKHLSDPTPRVLPAVSGVTDAVVVTTFICPSPTMALVWAAAPGADYHMTLVPTTAPEF